MVRRAGRRQAQRDGARTLACTIALGVRLQRSLHFTWQLAHTRQPFNIEDDYCYPSSCVDPLLVLGLLYGLVFCDDTAAQPGQRCFQPTTWLPFGLTGPSDKVKVILQDVSFIFLKGRSFKVKVIQP